LSPPCSPGGPRQQKDKLFSESLGKSLATPLSTPPPPFHGIRSIKTVLFSPLSVKGDLSSLLDLQPSGSETLIFGYKSEQPTRREESSYHPRLDVAENGSSEERLFF
jgi:hypothetical protein